MTQTALVSVASLTQLYTSTDPSAVKSGPVLFAPSDAHECRKPAFPLKPEAHCSRSYSSRKSKTERRKDGTEDREKNGKRIRGK